MSAVVSAAAAPLLVIDEVSIEAAYDIAATLTEVTRVTANGLLIIKGISPQHGSIYVIIPPFGDALLLPFAIQSSVV